MLNPTYQIDALREFNNNRGQLISIMLEDGLNNLCLYTDDWNFDNIELLIGNQWAVTATNGKDEIEFTTNATDQEVFVFQKVKAYGELCAEFGVKR